MLLSQLKKWFTLIFIDLNVPPTHFCVMYFVLNGMLLFCGAVRKVIMQGKKEYRGLKSVFLPVRMELIFSDLGITCVLLQFFFRFTLTIFSQAGKFDPTVTLKRCYVVYGIILELHSAGASNSFPFLVNTQKHLTRGLRVQLPP